MSDNASKRMNQLLRADRLAARGEPEEPVPEWVSPSEWGKPPPPPKVGSADGGAGTVRRRDPEPQSMNEVLRGWLADRLRR